MSKRFTYLGETVITRLIPLRLLWNTPINYTFTQQFDIIGKYYTYVYISLSQKNQNWRRICALCGYVIEVIACNSIQYHRALRSSCKWLGYVTSLSNRKPFFVPICIPQAPSPIYRTLLSISIQLFLTIFHPCFEFLAYSFRKIYENSNTILIYLVTPNLFFFLIYSIWTTRVTNTVVHSLAYRQ